MNGFTTHGDPDEQVALRNQSTRFRMYGDPNVQRALQNFSVRIPLKFQALAPDANRGQQQPLREAKPKPTRKRRSSTTTN